MKRMNMNGKFFSALLLCALCAVAGLALPTPAEAAKVRVEVEVDVDDNGDTKPAKKAAPKAAQETFPVTLENTRDHKVYVAILYHDGNAKDWRCRGWWAVEPHKEVYFKLSHVPGKAIYFYVEDHEGRTLSRSGTDKGVNRSITKQKFSFLDGKKRDLDKPYKVHFMHGGTGHDGWWKLTI